MKTNKIIQAIEKAISNTKENFYKITSNSQNKKLINMTSVTCSFKTCPKNCPLSSVGCYAKSYPLSCHATKVTEGKRGTNFKEMIALLKKRHTYNNIVRFGDVGDLPSENGLIINEKETKELSETLANARKISYAYTHYLSNKKERKNNIAILQRLKQIENGMTINISCEIIKDAIKYFKIGLNAIILLKQPENVSIRDKETIKNYWKQNKAFKKDGVQFVVCPMFYREGVSCATCGGNTPMCAQKNRSYVVCFPTHGNYYKKVNALLDKLNKK